MCPEREQPFHERRRFAPEALGLAVNLRRIDPDQANLADARQPQRVAVGVARDARRGALPWLNRIRPATAREGCEREEER
jgi:hypothetical protein